MYWVASLSGRNNSHAAEAPGSVVYKVIKNHICKLHLHICCLPSDALGIHPLSLYSTVDPIITSELMQKPMLPNAEQPKVPSQ